MNGAAARHVLVVVPARDEEQRLGACLDGVSRAALAAPDVVVDVLVVLDRCRDATGDVAAAHGVPTTVCDAGMVGASRALGVREARHRWPRQDADSTWVATTDADSVVPESWLLDHLAASRVADGLAGAVHPDPGEVGETLLTSWWRAHPRLRGVWGANLGVRLSAYDSCGGFSPVATGEDVRLVEALRAAGHPVSHGGTPVRTAGRLDARAPEGFAAYLRALTSEPVPVQP